MALVVHLSRKPAIEALRAFHEERLRIGASIVAYGRRLGEMLTAKVSTETLWLPLGDYLRYGNRSPRFISATFHGDSR
jgi:hypothetical protein